MCDSIDVPVAEARLEYFNSKRVVKIKVSIRRNSLYSYQFVNDFIEKMNKDKQKMPINHLGTKGSTLSINNETTSSPKQPVNRANKRRSNITGNIFFNSPHDAALN